MGKTSAPPLDGEAIRSARHAKFMTQAEVAGRVAEQCAADGIKFDRSGLSMIENGTVKRPSLKVVRSLAAVLELDPAEMFKAEDDPDEDDDESEAALAAQKKAAPRWNRGDRKGHARQRITEGTRK